MEMFKSDLQLDFQPLKEIIEKLIDIHLLYHIQRRPFICFVSSAKLSSIEIRFLTAFQCLQNQLEVIQHAIFTFINVFNLKQCLSEILDHEELLEQ